MPSNYSCYETRPDNQPKAPLWSPPCPGRSLPARVPLEGQAMDRKVHPGAQQTCLAHSSPALGGGGGAHGPQFPSRLQRAQLGSRDEGGQQRLLSHKSPSLSPPVSTCASSFRKKRGDVGCSCSSSGAVAAPYCPVSNTHPPILGLVRGRRKRERERDPHLNGRSRTICKTEQQL